MICIALSLSNSSIHAKETVLTGRQIYSERIQKYVFFSTPSIEKTLSAVNKTSADSLDTELKFNKDPFSIDWLNGEEICISNTLFAAIFSLLTFSTACYIVVGLQILNQFEKEKQKLQVQGDYKVKKPKIVGK